MLTELSTHLSSFINKYKKKYINGRIRRTMAKLLSEVLGSRKYAEIKTRSSRISPSMKFANLLVYGCILDVITSISSVAKVKANCEGVEYKQLLVIAYQMT